MITSKSRLHDAFSRFLADAFNTIFVCNVFLRTSKKSSPRKMIQVKVKKSSDDGGSQLKPVHSAFRQREDDGSASSSDGGEGKERPEKRRKKTTNGSSSGTKKTSSAVAKGYDTSAGKNGHIERFRSSVH